MSAQAAMRIDALNRDNYDTWRMQMQAILIKNDGWPYVNGEEPRPSAVAGDASTETALASWTKNDLKAKSDIILCISASELKLVKNCDTSRALWKKLEEYYSSQGPARKATLLKQLTLQRMNENEDIREHTNKFFDAVDKLCEMHVEIHPDLLAIMLLYSLPPSFENFRCAIEARDELPPPDQLRIKIVEESDARKNKVQTNLNEDTQNAMYTHKKTERPRFFNKEKSTKTDTKQEKFKYKCHYCRKHGHKAADCYFKQRQKPEARNAEQVGLLAENALQIKASTTGSVWCLDSGATSHVCKEVREFEKINDAPGTLNLANDQATQIVGSGTANFTANVCGNIKNISLKDTLYVPDIRTNLLSVGKIADKGFEILFKKNEAFIYDSKGDIKLTARRFGNLYYTQEKHQVKIDVNKNASFGVEKQQKSEMSWHRRLGHLNMSGVQELARKGTIHIHTEPKDTNTECEVCARGKMTRKPWKKDAQRTRSSELLEIIHTDVCGPMRTESLGKARYFITFIDDHSRWCEVRFVKTKDEIPDVIRTTINLIENQKGKKVKSLQSDNGTEYTNKRVETFLKDKGIRRRLTTPYTPEQNGISERRNRTLMEMARCLLIQADLPPHFWAEAVNTANYIRNRCPTKSLNGKIPFEIWNKKKPYLENLQEFGSKVYYLNKRPDKGKLEAKSHEGIFVGYGEESRGYRIWSPTNRRVEISRDVKFMSTRVNSETRYSDFIPEEIIDEDNQQTSIEIETIITPEETQEVGDNDTPSASRGRGRPKRIRTGLRGRPRKEYQIAHISNEELNQELSFLAEIPMTTALNGPDATSWMDAICNEIESIVKNDTWTMVNRPQNEKVIGSRIVLRNKYKPNGTIDRRKARLVAQGFGQQPGVHFNQTFAPVARASSIRTLISLAARFNMKIHQLDVTTAYLNGILDEVVYMEPPKYFEEAIMKIIREGKSNDDLIMKCKNMIQELKKGNKVCKLNKSLYGLRQAGRSWFQRLDSTLKKYGAISTKTDPCIYHIGKGKDGIYIAVYVDDILVVSSQDKLVSDFVEYLKRNFEVKYKGEAKQCLGIEFTRKQGQILLNQEGYILDVLKRFGMSDCKPASTPILRRPDLIPETNQSEEDLKLPYRELIGALTYLATSTRPDICFAVSYLSQFNSCYGSTHWKSAKRVLRYLKGTSDLSLKYEAGIHSVKGYADADWGNCPIDRRSYTGFIFMWNGPLSWESKKQRTVALSSTEAEYLSMTEATKEAVHISSLLNELKLKVSEPITLFNDNRGALCLAENSGFHNRTKHVDIRAHFVREAVERKLIAPVHIPTEEMAADFLTKGLSKLSHQHCVEMSSMAPNPNH